MYVWNTSRDTHERYGTCMIVCEPHNNDNISIHFIIFFFFLCSASVIHLLRCVTSVSCSMRRWFYFISALHVFYYRKFRYSRWWQRQRRRSTSCWNMHAHQPTRMRAKFSIAAKKLSRSWWVCTTHNNVPGFLKIIPVTSYRNNNRGSAIFLHAFQLCVLFIVLFRWIENGWPSPKFVIHMIHSRCMVEITTRDKINSSNRILANGMLFTLDYSWLEYSEHSNDFMLNLGRNWQRSTQNRSSH